MKLACLIQVYVWKDCHTPLDNQPVALIFFYLFDDGHVSKGKEFHFIGL